MKVGYYTRTKKTRKKMSDAHICGSKNKIQADHILPVKDYPESRLDKTNGQVLCINCHKFKTFVLEKNVADILLTGGAY